MINGNPKTNNASSYSFVRGGVFVELVYTIQPLLHESHYQSPMSWIECSRERARTIHDSRAGFWLAEIENLVEELNRLDPNSERAKWIVCFWWRVQFCMPLEYKRYFGFGGWEESRKKWSEYESVFQQVEDDGS